MGVVIDKATFERYQSVKDSPLKTLIQLTVIRDEESTSNATFASVKTEGGRCPFLGQEMDCTIQREYGEEYLSRTCDTYPRAYTKVDSTLERSLYLSCPEAARLILLRPGGIRFSAPGKGRPEKYDDFPTIETGDSLYGGKPYLHMTSIRNFAVNLLRNRSYAVWERLIILGMYCDQLSRIQPDQLEVGAPLLTQSFISNIEGRNFQGTLEGIIPNTGLMLNVAISSIEDRISSAYTANRFRDCYQEFIQGIGFKSGIDTPTLAKQYTIVEDRYYKPFIAEREYIWENYLVSKAYKDVFPFGPQKSAYGVQRTLYQEYVLLAVQYLFARTLFTGQTGFVRNLLTEADVVLLIQSYSRAVEHNLPYLTKILRSLEQGKISELPTLASLLKR